MGRRRRRGKQLLDDLEERVLKFVSCVLLLVLSCVVCDCCWLAVCIVVVVLYVLLSYVYLL
jgi:hypothetical protein